MVPPCSPCPLSVGCTKADPDKQKSVNSLQNDSSIIKLEKEVQQLSIENKHLASNKEESKSLGDLPSTLPTEAEMNSKNKLSSLAAAEENGNTLHNTEIKSQPKRVKANHRRNLSLDFRAMGIVLPPLPDAPGTQPLPRRLHQIPEVNSPPLVHQPAPKLSNIPEFQSGAPEQSAITPKLKHVMKRILTRRIN